MHKKINRVHKDSTIQPILRVESVKFTYLLKNENRTEYSSIRATVLENTFQNFVTQYPQMPTEQGWSLDEHFISCLIKH